MADLRLISLDDVVIFPGMPVTLSADVRGEERVFLVARRGGGYATVGVVAEAVEPSGRGRKLVSFIALHRGIPGAAHTDPHGISCSVQPRSVSVAVDSEPDEVVVIALPVVSPVLATSGGTSYAITHDVSARAANALRITAAASRRPCALDRRALREDGARGSSSSTRIFA